MISGIFAGDVRKLSIEACFPDLIAAATARRSFVRGLMASAPKGDGPRGLFTLKGGLGRIGLAAQDQRCRFSCRLPFAKSSRNRARASLCTQPRRHARASRRGDRRHTVAAKLLWPLSPELGAAPSVPLEYLPLSVVHWESKGARMPEGFGYLACPSENLFAMGTMFRGSHFSSFVRGVEADEPTLLAGLSRDVDTLTGGSVGRILRVDRYAHAVFQPTLAIGETRAKLGPLSDAAGITLAGSYLGASAMKDALASGLLAGRRAHESLQRMPAWSRSLS